jgi:hypothetical protein
MLGKLMTNRRVLLGLGMLVAIGIQIHAAGGLIGGG